MEPAPRNILREDPLSKDDTMALRGMLVILIIVFHCSFYYGFTFPDLGHIAVSMFLFFSGYGLELSLHRKEGYLKGFPSNRIFGILVQYWTIVLAIAVIGLLMYPGSDPIDSIASALLKTPHWFVVEILAFYVLFYLTGTLLRKEGIWIWTAPHTWSRHLVGAADQYLGRRSVTDFSHQAGRRWMRTVFPQSSLTEIECTLQN